MKKSNIRWVLFWIIPMIGFGLLFGAGEKLMEWGAPEFEKGKNLTLNDLEFAIVVTDRHGEEIYRNFETENREWVSLEKIPESLKIATIIAEDKRFYQHQGMDFKGILRAAVENATAGRIVQGGSTLTQQIARKIYLTDERKLREIFIALGIEQSYSKDEILEMYLNTAPYGARLNGVAVSAKAYFGKDVSELSNAEALALAVLPKDPVRLSRVSNISNWLGDCPIDFVDDQCSPFIDHNYDFSRVESLLFAVSNELGWSQEEAKETWQALRKLEINNAHRWVDDDFQHFRFYIQNFLAEQNFDFSKADTGLVIKTTLDAKLHKQIYRQLRIGSGDLLQEHNIGNFAALILDHQSRGPLVWIGSKYFWNEGISGQVDVLNSRRQTGSTIKPFIYAAAIEEGYQPPTIFYDSVVRFRGDQYRLSNSDGHFSGGIRMTQALATSRNIPAAKAMLLAGGEKVVRSWMDTNFGFGINENYKGHFFGWTLALGTAPVRLVDLANGYATLGTSQYKSICPILSVETLAGKPMTHPCQVKIARNFNKDTSYFISNILSNEAARPNVWSELVTPNLPMAIKTGTSSKRVNGQLAPVDDLVVGYTPEATVLLWGGNTDGKALTPGSVSIYALGTTWRDMANTFLTEYPEKFAVFQRPSPMLWVNGELATIDYRHPGYQVLNRFVYRNIEKGLNPLIQLDHER